MHIHIYIYITITKSGFPGGSDSKESAYNVGDLGSIPGLGRTPGEGNGNPLQYSCLENSMYREAWQATVHGVTKSQTRLSDCAQHVTKSYIFNSFQPKSHFIQGTFPRLSIQDLPTSEHFLNTCLTAPCTLMRLLRSLISMEEGLIQGRGCVWKYSAHPPAWSLDCGRAEYMLNEWMNKHK